MLEQAITKINEEIEKENNNHMVQFFGQYILSELEEHPEYAERILQEGKSVLKATKDLERYALSKRTGAMAYVPDPDGYAIILQHFGCWGGEPFEIPAEPEHKAYTPPARQTTTNNVGKSAVTSKGKKTPPADQMSLFDDEEEGAGCGC